MNTQYTNINKKIDNVLTVLEIIRESIRTDTIIYFKMQKKSQPERVIFKGKPPTNKEIEDYFEEQCGGVYRYWKGSHPMVA